MPRPTALTPLELERAMQALPDWQLDGWSLVRTDQASTFAGAIDWVVAIARIADDMDHHPDIDIRYRTVTWRLSTHSVGAITDLDIRLAREIDQVVGGDIAKPDMN